MKIQVLNTSRCVSYERSMLLEPAQFNIPCGSWFYKGLERLSCSSNTQAYYLADVQALKRAMGYLKETPQWKKLLSKEIREIDSQVLIELYAVLERELQSQDIKATTKRNTGGIFRRFIQRFLTDSGNGTAAELAKNFYRSKLRYSFHPRKMISDSISRRDEYIGLPVGTLPHGTIEELKQATVNRIQSDVDSIEKACLRELSIFDEQVNWLKKAAEHEIPEGFDEVVRQQMRIDGKGVDLASPKDLLAFVLKHTGGAKDPGKPPLGLKYMPGSDRVVAYANAELKIPISTARELYYLQYVTRGSVLVACLLLLQMHTRWNASSVISLRSEDVEVTANGFVIQGFKARTDDHTPPVLVTTTDRGAYAALRILLARQQHLKRLGWIHAHSSSLWLARRPKGAVKDRVFAGFQRPLELFCDAHGFPRFGLDQMRTQMLALTSVKAGGIEAARLAAGHAHLSTTGHYLDQLLLNRLNSAINLRFQREIESAIVYKISTNSSGRSEVDFDARTNEYFYPVGNGSLCANPHSPPDPAWMRHGICEGKNCNVGAACVNQRIVIDHSRMAEVVVISRYYQKNWQRLIGSNKEAFSKHHLPAMLFNMALESVILKSPYAAIMRAIRKEATNEAK